MSSAEKYIPQYTREDYRNWEGDWELIEGVAISMSPSPSGLQNEVVSMSPSPNGPHERAVSRLIMLLGNEMENQSSDCFPYAGLDWIVSNETIVRPDLMVVCGDQPDGHLEKPPVLVAEVLSPSTWKLDTGSKRRIYKDNGVNVYLIVDTDLKKIEIVDFRSENSVTIQEAESSRVSLADNLAIDVIAEKIFR